MKKKLLAYVLALCMVLSLMPATALADEATPPNGEQVVGTEEPTTPPTTAPATEPEKSNTPSDEAPADETGEPDAEEAEEPTVEEEGQDDLLSEPSLLSEAVPTEEPDTKLPNADENGLIKLEKDVVLSQTWNIAQSTTVTLDLNGYTLTGPNKGYTINNAGNLTIQGNGKIVAENPGSATVRSTGTMKLSGITVESKFIAVKSDENTTLTVENCTLNAPEIKGSGIQNWGTATVSDTTINALVGVMALSYTEKGTAYDSSTTLTDVIVNGAKVAIDSGRYDETTSKQTVIISGGSYDGTIRVSAGSAMEIKDSAKVEDVVVSNNSSYSLGENVHNSTGPSHVAITDNVVMNSVTAAAKTNTGYYSSINDAINADGFSGTVTMCGDNTENVVIPSGKTVTLDLHGKTLTIPSDKDSAPLTVKGNLTVVDNTAVGPTVKSDYTVDYTGGKIIRDTVPLEVVKGGTFTLKSGKLESNYGNGFNVDGATTMDSWSTPISSKATVEGGYIEAQEYGIGVYGNGAHLTVKDGVVVARDNAAIAGNGSYDQDSDKDGTKDNYGGTLIDIVGGTIIGHITTNGFIATGVYHPQSGVLNISGGTIYADNGVGICVRNGEVNISGDAKIIATGNESGKVGDASTQIPGKSLVIDYATGYNHNNGSDDTRKVTVTGGYFSAERATVDVYTTDGNKVPEGFITGGYFTSDPGAYAATGYASVASDKQGYTYMVREKGADEIIDKPVVTEPEVTSPMVDSAEKTAATNSAKTVEAPTIVTAAVVTEKEKSAAVEKAKTDLSLGSDTEVIIYKQTYLDIEAKSFTTEGAKSVMTLEITPKMQIVASTALSADDIVTDENGKNAVTYGDPKTLTINESTPITLTLPDVFKDKTVFIQHQAKNGRTYYYQAAADANGELTFVSKHGFSPFTFSTVNDAVAEITVGGETIGYATLQDAVDAVANNGTIKLLKDGSATVSTGITFSVDKNGHNVTINAGSGYKISSTTEGNVVTYTVTKRSSGGGSSSGGSSSGGGGSSSSTYSVSVDKATGGSVTVSPKKASKGDTVTITVKPETGYELDEIVVTDKNGDAVKLTEKSGGKYTFKMPGSAVTVEASFVKTGEKTTEPADLPFTDVSADDWYADAARYVYENGLMAGTSNTTFGPDVVTTRGMIVTILYRLEGEPAVTAGTFTDVAPGQYYTSAVAWAAANGVVTGYDNGGFGPNDPITREQMAAILYRYAQLKGCDVSQRADLSVYADGSAVSTYAAEALSWANASGLVTGTSATTLAPQGQATRAQAATILMRFCENVAK